MATIREQRLAAELRRIAEQADRMISNTLKGSWSTQNIEGLTQIRDRAYALLGELGL